MKQHVALPMTEKSYAPSFIAEAQVEKCTARVVLACATGCPHSGSCTPVASREGCRSQPTSLQNGFDICEHPSRCNQFIQSLLVDPVRVTLRKVMYVILCYAAVEFHRHYKHHCLAGMQISHVHLNEATGQIRDCFVGAIQLADR
jgi:hypothetical protein